jgi:hypothetical protein
MGVHNGHGRLRLGKQGVLIPPWVRLFHNHLLIGVIGINMNSFLSVAWTMTEYDGTTQ